MIPGFAGMGSDRQRYRRAQHTGILAGRLREGLCSSFCISLATLPVLLSSFYEWNLLSVLLNVLVIPLMGVLMGGILMLVLAGGICSGLGIPAGAFLSLAALPVRGIFFFCMKSCVCWHRDCRDLACGDAADPGRSFFIWVLPFFF